MGSDPQYAKYPNLQLAQHISNIITPSLSSTHARSSEVLLSSIKEHKQAPLYRYLAHPTDGLLTAKHVQGLLPWDESLYESLKKDNDEELQGFDKELEEAKEKAGESEVTEAMGKRADFYARVVDKENALKAYEELLEKTATVGLKIDIVLAMTRLNMFFDDKLAVKKLIDRAKQLVDSGGDWDRRNRLKAYQGLQLLSIRQFALAAPLLLDSLSTFTSNELCDYETLVLYAVLAGVISLSRVDFKTKVVDSAEVLAVFGSRREVSGDIEMADSLSGFSSLETLVNSFYLCEYKPFFQALLQVEETFLLRDRLLAEHAVYFTREMRRRAYAQLLESYRVRSIASMAEAFGVSQDWLDKDLSKFIPNGGLNCTIDRVGGVIETNRPDGKNRQYQEVVKQGDAVLTKLQKFGQVVRLRGSERA